MISIEDLWSRDKSDFDVIKSDVINYIAKLERSTSDLWKLNFIHSFCIILTCNDKRANDRIKIIRDDIITYMSREYKYSNLHQEKLEALREKVGMAKANEIINRQR